MSNDIQKADQIAFHFYTKLFYVVNQARATAEPRTQGKVDKWFNLETQDSDLFTREAKEPYKNISQAPPPPLEIQVVLTIPELANNQVLVYLTPESSRLRIEPTPQLLVLETFTLTFTPHNVDPASVDVALPTIYKHGIPLFRSLFSLLRVLPSWKLYKRLKSRRAGASRHLGIQLRVRPSKETADILTFDMPPSPSLTTPFATQTHLFSEVPHPLGSLGLTVRYLSTPEFHLQELESVLSSRFLSQDLDGAEGFVPTLTKNNQRDSSIISTGSTTNTRSPPKNIIARAVSTGGGGDLADRFILPARTASNPGSGSGAHQIQPARQTATGDIVGYGAPSAAPPVAHSPPSGLAISRLRKESIGSSASSSFRETLTHHVNPSLSSLSSSPSSGPMAIRRPGPTPVNPFKSNTVLSSSTAGSSSSPSLSIRQGPMAGSPLSTGLALGASGHGHSRSTSVSSVTVPPGAGVPSSYGSRHPPSPIGIGFATGSRPSPSSQNDKRPGTAGSIGSTGSGLDDTRDRGGEGVAIPPRKRYSSSFGHRYVSSVGSGLEAAGSGQAGSSGRGTPASGSTQAGMSGLGIEGVTGSGSGGGEREGAMTSSYFSQNAHTDDDDISVFVQDIDSRKPLSGRWKEREDRDRRRAGSAGSGKSPERRRSALGLGGQSHERERSDSYRKPLSLGGRFGTEAGTPLSPIASAPPLSPIPSAPSSRFSTATGSSSTTVTAGSTATVTPATRDPEPELSTSPPASSVSPTRGPMLTSRGEVDERLRKMNETFLKSLEGISGAGTNEARRRERERKREREREREREKERERDKHREREHDRISRRSSGEETEPSTSNPSSPVGRDDGNSFPGRGLSFRPLAGSPTITPATPVAISGNGREDRDHHRSDSGSGGRWVPYSMGMGLRRGFGEGIEPGPEVNASMVSQGGSTGEGQGSEEVIGRMDFGYEGPRTKDAYYDRR